MKKIIVLVMGMATLVGLAQVPVPATTPWSRTLLKSADATGARGTLGVVNSNWVFNTDQFLAPGNVLTLKGGGVFASNLPTWLAATNKIFVTVSATGTNNGTSTIFNGGCEFGIDTPGTTSSGLQEALNSMPKGTEWGPTATGIHIQLGSGYYYFTNALWFSNTFVCGVRISGNTLVDTKLVYAGTGSNTNLITFCSGPNTNATDPYQFPLHLEFDHLGFSAIHDELPNVMLYCTNYSHLSLDLCNFTSWTIMTNQAYGSGVSIATGGSPPTGLVGLRASQTGDHGTFLHDIYCAGLATGLHLECDHAYCYGLKFADISSDGLNFQANKWTNTNPYSLGAAILRTPGMDSHYYQCHFYGCGAGLVVVGVGSGNIIQDSQYLENPQVEGCDYPLATTDTNYVSFRINDASVVTKPNSDSEWKIWKVAKTPIYSYSTGVTFPRYVAYNSGAFWGDAAGLTGTLNKVAVSNAPYVLATNVFIAPPAETGDSFKLYQSGSTLRIEDISTGYTASFDGDGSFTISDGMVKSRYGYMINQSTPDVWPALADVGGQVSLVVSNGVLYSLHSKPGSLNWVKTNLVGGF